MREIKFRAWDGKRMMEVGVLDIETDSAIDYVNWYDNYCGERVSYGKNEKGVLMQYTGFLDKNEIEIYEGDVVRELDEHRCSADSKMHSPCGVVVYSAPKFYARHDDNLKCTPICDTIEGVEVGTNCKIIGNIYENPELVEK